VCGGIAEERESYEKANVEWGFLASIPDNKDFKVDTSSSLR
jgi:hypothetical protein